MCLDRIVLVIYKHVYVIFVDSHAHYMDEAARYKLGEFEEYETAVATAQKIVDEFLLANHKPGMTAESLFELYSLFGEDPFIVPDDDESSFSAWAYAKMRCQVLCSTGV